MQVHLSVQQTSEGTKNMRSTAMTDLLYKSDQSPLEPSLAPIRWQCRTNRLCDWLGGPSVNICTRSTWVIVA